MAGDGVVVYWRDTREGGEAMSKDARYRLYCISPQTFLAMLNWQRRDAVCLPKLDLPDGSELEAVNYDPMRDAFLLRVYHPTFEPVPDGQEIPTATGTAEWVQMTRRPHSAWQVGDVVYWSECGTKRQQSSYWHQRCLEAEAMASYQIGCEWRDKCKAAEKRATEAEAAAWERACKASQRAHEFLTNSLKSMIGK